MHQDNAKKTEKAVTDLTKLTPRKLVRKQVENENFHVSEEDMKNLDTSLPAVDSDPAEIKKEADKNENK